MFPIFKIKGDDGYDILININNIQYIKKDYNTKYRIQFLTGEITLSWKEYNRLDDVFLKEAESE